MSERLNRKWGRLRKNENYGLGTADLARFPSSRATFTLRRRPEILIFGDVFFSLKLADLGFLKNRQNFWGRLFTRFGDFGDENKTARRFSTTGGRIQAVIEVPSRYSAIVTESVTYCNSRNIGKVDLLQGGGRYVTRW